MKKIWILGVIFGVLCSGCLTDSNMLQVSVITGAGENDFKVEVADSFEERTQGLQHVAELEKDEGMWFVFDSPQMLSFWMKDTLIALDIIFVSADLEIVSIAHNVPPCREADPEQVSCENYFSGMPAQYVLEISGGLASELGISAGDKITLPK